MILNFHILLYCHTELQKQRKTSQVWNRCERHKICRIDWTSEQEQRPIPIEFNVW
jgi:hypothetical protein